MNLAIIVLIALVFIFIYSLYVLLANLALTKGNLRLSVGQTISGTSLELINKSEFYYDGWMFINKGGGFLFYREIAVKIEKDATSNKMLFNVYHYTTSGASNAWVLITTVTDEVPINKWTHFAIRYKSNILEVYLNGKLVKTVMVTVDTSKISNDQALVIGTQTGKDSAGNTLDGYITKLRRLKKSIDSPKIWESYLEGNGQYSGLLGSLLNYFDLYSAKMTIFKNDVKQKDFKLF